ncbi:MAG TPA: 2-oxoglutarate dehydrogenase E1 component [Acidobacteriota bacterium]|nr:2-oxoglutarate dehydrogenase E1 component [Acidobacteriota bacterium]HNT17401.1 2-oxoglutarate dehydrogenase E1 component [Acidobacteriota bacterium]HPA27564.1 2-oxoglutarate dehydrogenase E1 component [Acidobacteriota bacterium]HQO18800.1 2-oxoglutarate dehydrogenase E1 component [Acidobacteriota bacterium]HQQ46689.1 2-oxoglutarate dehydrogenase E1 component [Acidobacteriota bacterium]
MGTLRTDGLLANGQFIEIQYERWKKDPASVGPEWDIFFQGFSMASCPRSCVAAESARKQSQVASLIYAYRSLGHLGADINPLEPKPRLPEPLKIESFGLYEDDLGRVFDTGHLGGPERAALEEIIASLTETYLGTCGAEYIHIQDRDQRRWLQKEMEPGRNKPELSRGEKLEVLKQLTDAELFEAFLQGRYPGQKRFSLEGLESLIVSVHAIIEEAPELGVEEIVLGMAHRGRLNILANILDKPYEEIFSEFEDIAYENLAGGDGDVKYHKGFSSDHVNRSGKSVHLSLTPNPSHLEAVDPVALGRTRAKQRLRNDTDERIKVVPVLIHGDAAFAGQGVVAETLNLGHLEGYRVGGTIHVIANNQIGFTTAPEEGRSTRYATEVAKMTEAPIFHVNAEDPEMVFRISLLALKFRQKFRKDAVIDIIGYRKYGHSEGDEPSFTQPLTYRKIRSRPSVRVIYAEKLLREEILTEEEASGLKDKFTERLRLSSEKVAPGAIAPTASPFRGRWEGFGNPYGFEKTETAVPSDLLHEVFSALTRIPRGFSIHSKLGKRMDEIGKASRGEAPVDWALAELLAFGTLLAEGHGIRLSGEDSRRGTFSQRHAVLRDHETGEEYIPLNNIRNEQGRFCVYNSMLSEFAVLGFDYGYSIVDPHMMVLWEAQFGDFVNGGQVVIDQFLSSSLSKWGVSSGIVLLLPHGNEGQGPEHSNGYLERFLAGCAGGNMEVVNLTNASQYFHLLRRQMKRPFRRPLVVMTPKSLLRSGFVASPLREFTEGSFENFIVSRTDPKDVKRLIFCSGKIFFDLLAVFEETNRRDVDIVRIEQLYPFDGEQFLQILRRYGGAREFVWAQEETRNRGAWTFMREKLEELAGIRLIYCGRKASPGPAGGSMKQHLREQRNIVSEAFSVKE